MKQKVKKYFYISLFVLLGIIVNFIIHAGLELTIIELLMRDFERFSLGLSWETWFVIHDVGTAVLLVVFAALGFWQGRYWWRRIYEEKSSPS